MARPVWTGTISFGLVNVPVKAHTAVRDHDVHFHQLEKKSGSRIRNRKVSEKSGKEVDADDIEMGFEIARGSYVTFDKDELKELKPASTRAIEVTDFVALDAIDPIFYERTYWLVPADDSAKKPYGLLLAAMEDRERVAIGTVVMRNKEYLTAIRPLDGALAMSTMRFADEVVPRADIDGMPARRAKPDAKTLKMATQLLDALESEWEPKRYHDTYTEELKARIEAQDAGEEIVEEAPKEESSAKVVDLMAALEASVESAKSARSKSRAVPEPQERLAAGRPDSTATGSRAAPGHVVRGAARSSCQEFMFAVNSVMFSGLQSNVPRSSGKTRFHAPSTTCTMTMHGLDRRAPTSEGPMIPVASKSWVSASVSSSAWRVSVSPLATIRSTASWNSRALMYVATELLSMCSGPPSFSTSGVERLVGVVLVVERDVRQHLVGALDRLAALRDEVVGVAGGGAAPDLAPCRRPAAPPPRAAGSWLAGCCRSARTSTPRS